MATATHDDALRDFERITHLRQVADRLADALRDARRRVDGARELAGILFEAEETILAVPIEVDEEHARRHLAIALSNLKEHFAPSSISADLDEAEDFAADVLMRLDAAEMAARRPLRTDG